MTSVKVLYVCTCVFLSPLVRLNGQIIITGLGTNGQVWHFLELYTTKTIYNLSVISEVSRQLDNATIPAQQFVLLSSGLTSDLSSVLNCDYAYRFGGLDDAYVRFIDGDDGVLIMRNGMVIDRFGNVDGTDMNSICNNKCNYRDGWARRKFVSRPFATFKLDEWYIEKNAFKNGKNIIFPCKQFNTSHEDTNSTSDTSTQKSTQTTDTIAASTQPSTTSTAKTENTATSTQPSTTSTAKTENTATSTHPSTTSTTTTENVATSTQLSTISAAAATTTTDNTATTSQPSTTSTRTTGNTSTSSRSTITLIATTENAAEATPTPVAITASGNVGPITSLPITIEKVATSAQQSTTFSDETTTSSQQSIASTNKVPSETTKVIYCPVLILESHTMSSTDDTRVGMIVVLTCTVGYFFSDGSNTRSIICTPEGQWSAPIPMCKARNCPPLPRFETVFISTIGTLPGTVVAVHCLNRMRMKDGTSKKKITCSENGVWTDWISDCSDRACQPVPYVANSVLNTTSAGYGSAVSVTCKKGFLFPDETESAQITCRNDSTWHPVVENCYPIVCPVVPTVAHANINSTLRGFDDLVMYTCHKGYHVPGVGYQYVIKCLKNRKWNGTTSDCKIVECPKQEIITNAKSTAKGSVYLSQARHTCEAGYRFLDGRNDKNVTCTEFGQWSESGLDCKAERCFPIPEAENTIPSTTNTTWGITVTYTCAEGYRFENNATQVRIQCQTNSLWNASVEPCRAMSCTSPPEIDNANKEASHGHNLFGTVVLYTCQRGHVFQDGTTRKLMSCTTKGDWVDWMPQISSCQAVVCGEIPLAGNGTTNDKARVYNSSVTFHCPDGFEFPNVGPKDTIVCTESAEWDHKPTSCIPVRCPTLPFWADAEFNTTETEYETHVSYSCKENFVFPDKAEVKTSFCSKGMQWEPQIEACKDIQSIIADLKGVTYEAKNAVPIGTVAVIIVSFALGIVILLDLNKLFTDLILMKDNVLDFYKAVNTVQRRRHMITPANTK